MSGSIRKLIWNGQTYPVKATADFTENPEYEITAMASSGEPIFNAQKMVPTIDGVEIFADAVTKAQIRADIRNRVVSDMSYIEENGDSNYSRGRISETGRTTSEITMTLQLMPIDPWEVIPA